MTNQPTPPQSRTILRKPAVRQKTGLSNTTIYRLMHEGKFPRSIRLTENTVGWFEDEIDGWLASRQTTRNVSFPAAERARSRKTGQDLEVR